MKAKSEASYQRYYEELNNKVDKAKASREELTSLLKKLDTLKQQIDEAEPLKTPIDELNALIDNYNKLVDEAEQLHSQLTNTVTERKRA